MTIPIIPFSAENILATLRGQGLRITRSRRGIVLALFAADGPLSLTELQARALECEGILPDYATVFRMMILLESLNLAHKVNLRRSCSYYELTDPSKHHDHLVCTQCGAVKTLETPGAVKEIQRVIERDFGYSGLHHSLGYFGWCPQCAASISAAESTPVAA